MKPKELSADFMRDLSEAVGRVIISFALLEHSFTMALAKLLKLTMLQERALIRPMSISTKIDLTRNLSKSYLKGDELTYLKHLLKDIKSCADHRNDLAHSLYGHKHGKFALLTFSGTARLAGQPIAWTPEALEEIVVKIGRVTVGVRTLPRRFPKNLKLPKLRQPSVPSVDD
jgi:hypothetical protein